MNHPRTTTFSIIAAAAILVLSACGTTGTVAQKTTTTAATPTTATVTSTESTPSTEPTTTTSTTDPSNDAQARADAIDVSEVDLPGWTTRPHKADEDAGSGDIYDTCLGTNLDSITVAKHNSDDFVTGDIDNSDKGSQLQTATRVIVDEAAATELTTAITEPDNIACFDTELKKQLTGGSGAKITGSLKAADTLKVSGVDQSAAYSGTFEFETGSKSIKMALAFVLIRTGDLVTGVGAAAVDEKPDGAALSTVMDRVAELHQED